MRRLLTVLLVTCAALAAAVTPAQAHNVLTSSDPRDGARLASVPGRVTLTFDQPVRADFAQVALTRPDRTVSRTAVDVVENKVRATLPSTHAAGAYVIGYQIVSNDGHPVSGKISFTVTGTTGQTQATPGTTGQGQATTDAGGPASASTAPPIKPLSTGAVPSSGSGSWVWGLLVVAVLLSGVGILVVARHGRPRKAQRA